VTLELSVDIFDENLAADLLAEEADIAADDRTKIDERGDSRPVNAVSSFRRAFVANSGSSTGTSTLG
jgi:hypothetical protein